jgi:DNA polymerase-3 subunit epsilon
MRLIEELEQLPRDLIVFDTETTGPDPAVDRVCEIGFIHIKRDGTVREWQSYIHPTIPMPHEACYGNPATGYEGHGITDEKLNSCRHCGLSEGGTDAHQQLGDNPHTFQRQPTFAELAPHLIKGFADSDLSGYNIKRFDVPIMAAEFKRAGIEWAYDKLLLLDGYRIWQYSEARTLSDACERFLKRKHTGAHRALDDVRASLEIIRAQLKEYDRLPRSLQKLHELLYPVDPNAIDPDGKIIWVNGIATMNFGSKYKGKPLHMMARRDLDWLANTATGISPSVKRICKEAMAGRYPSQLKLPEVN